MVLIPVPTGFKDYTVTLTATRMLSYQCSSCGKKSVHEFRIVGYGCKQYHAFQSKDKKDAIKKATEEVARKDLDAKDQRLFQQVNVEHDYSSIDFAVNCPDCNTLQPWSDMRGILRKSNRLADLKTAVFNPPTYVNASNIDELSNQRASEDKSEEPLKPAVGARSDSSANRAGEPRKNSSKPVVRYCAKCGAQMRSNAVFCPKCGYKRMPASQ